MRERGKRTWIKVHCYQTLHGSVSYQLTDAEQAVWIKLLCLCGLCTFEGLISDNDRRPYPHEFIAHELHISLELFKSTLAKCQTEGRITENEEGIHITNWKVYQSEYQRQKPYRQAKGSGKEIHKQCKVCDYKGVTNEEYCPKCREAGKDSSLERDYEGGKYGHMVRK